jgi:hypothetical protein
MSVHKWRRRPTKHFGEVWVPFAQIDIQGADGKFQAFSLQIDSGAVVSLLRRSVADLLGLDLEAGRRIELSGVAGGSTVAHLHELQTRFADAIQFAVPFAIASTEHVPNLLGRLGVFDLLQVDFDATLEETSITPPWLSRDDRRIWEFLLHTSDHILGRWTQMELPEPTRKVACRFINRAGQVFASAAGLLKLHRTYAGPALIRTMFELAMQFEHLMDDPGPRAQKYSDFTHVTKYKESMALANNPVGPISQRVAESPLRAEGEPRIRAEYVRVRCNFLKDKDKSKVWDKWYCMTTFDLAKELGWLGEYRVVYTSCSSWAHGDPFSTERITSHPFAAPMHVFGLCYKYYARMLLKVADTAKVVLTSEQYEGLKAMTTRFE